MKELLASPWLWYYVIVSWFNFMGYRSWKRFSWNGEWREGLRLILGIMSNLSFIATIVFLICALFRITWWYVPVAIVISQLSNIVLNLITVFFPDELIGLIGCVVMPILLVLMYTAIF